MNQGNWNLETVHGEIFRLEKLSCSPFIAAQIMKVLEKSNPSTTDLAKWISLDQVLTARILKLANSHYYGYSKHISTLNLAIITITREKALNALSPDVVTELTTAIAELELDDDAPVIALTGAGDKAFVAGADIAAMRDMNPMEAVAFSEMGANLCQAMETSSKTYIAAVNGFALGGGCEVALACDFVYASTKAKLGQPEVKLGIIPGFGGTQRLPRVIGLGPALELLATGRHVKADEALRLGLVNHVYAADQLLPEARKLADTIAANGPIAVRYAMEAALKGRSLPMDEALWYEANLFGLISSTADMKEGMRAFLEKRKAEFRDE